MAADAGGRAFGFHSPEGMPISQRKLPIAMLVTLLAAVTFAIWLYLSAGRGGFWLAA